MSNKTEWIVRDGALTDEAIIVEFNKRLAEETEGKTLTEEYLVPGVRSLLEDSSKGRYFVVEHEDEVIGQLMLTYEWSDWRNGTIYWLQSVYVDQRFRRTGVFSALMMHVKQLAIDDPSVIGIRLYVEQENDTARKTYEKLGFINPKYQVMETLENRGISKESE